jgi:hypothetical protein
MELASSFSEEPVSWLPRLGLLRGEKRGLAMRSLYRIVNFPRKIPCSSLEANAKCIQKWYDFERDHNWIHSQKYIPRLRRIIRRWLKDIDLNGLVPGHGPGTTSEGYDNTFDKYRYWYITPGINILSHKYDIWVCDTTKVEKAPAAMVVLVPKNWKTPRLISAEPMPHQWAQQALMKRLYSHFARHRYLKHRLPLQDQTCNQDYAYYGSMGLGWATVDLSSASDSVSLAMVKDLFKGTSIYEYLLLTRTSRARVGNLVVKLKKFAPMGSALSFPIESLIFAACCEVACSTVGLNGAYSVYGDDIAINYKAIPTLFDILQSLNFEVNKEKSFYDPDIPFRESCGKEYYAGVDVTPLYYRIEAYRAKTSYDSAVQLCNNAFENGYSLVRNHLIKVALPKCEHLWVTPECQDRVSGGIFTTGDMSKITLRDPKTKELCWIPRVSGTKVLTRDTELSTIRNASCSDQAVYDWLAKAANADRDTQLAVGRSWRRRQRRARLVSGWWIMDS